MTIKYRQLGLVAGAVVFALAHTQAPLYWSNQNQYFLHGLAQGGLGHLDRDWLANTVDPTPVFSAGVAWTCRYLGSTAFYVVFAAILEVYFVSLMAIGAVVPGGPRTALGRLRLAAGLIAIHAAIGRWGSVQLLGADYLWFLQSGVAGQYVLGPGLQPSTFGVFLIAAIAAFALERLALAAGCLIFACIVHPTYLLPAALLTLGFMHVLWWEKRKRACIAFGIGTLLAALPVAIESVLRFAPTSIVDFQKSQNILVEFRLPHHAIIRQWFDWIAVLQIAWIGLGIWLVRRSRLFPILLIAFLGSLILSLLQFLTKSDTLALLFPWRMSAVLVPVATTVVLARIITVFHPSEVGEARMPLATQLLFAIVLLLAASSGVFQFSAAAYPVPTAEQGLYDFVRRHRQPGDVYLLPVRVPDLRSGPRGSPSTTFVPPRDAAGENKVPIDLQRFRLATGAPIYVDFKSIPYKDVEVIEWRERLARVERWLQKPRFFPELPVTHVIMAAGIELEGLAFDCIFRDGNYAVYTDRRKW